MCLSYEQTATSLAIEAKYMRRWEFDSIAQAETSIISWFSGTPFERLLLEQHLNSMIGISLFTFFLSNFKESIFYQQEKCLLN